MHTLIIDLPLKSCTSDGAKVTLSVPSKTTGMLAIDIQLTVESLDGRNSPVQHSKRIKFAMEFQPGQEARMHEAEWDGVQGYREVEGMLMNEEERIDEGDTSDGSKDDDSSEEALNGGVCSSDEDESAADDDASSTISQDV